MPTIGNDEVPRDPTRRVITMAFLGHPQISHLYAIDTTMESEAFDVRCDDITIKNNNRSWSIFDVK